jgi:hypothetical protein
MYAMISDGQIGWPHDLVIVNSEALNIGIQESLVYADWLV